MKIKNTGSKIKVLLLITGSIAAVRIPLLVSQLAKENYEIRCVLSKNAEKIIKPLSLSILSRNSCVLEDDQWLNSQSSPLHIELSNWADILIIAPLTATTLSKWVTGNAEGLIPSILIANIKPIIVAPAMNTQMWLNKAVQKNYDNLQTYENLLSLHPSEGLLACDAIGIGKLPPNDLIQLALEFIASHNENPYRKDLLNKDILITGGCTSEKIDAARHITNKSSGALGLLLSQVARFRGARVTYLHGPLKIDKNLTDGIKRYEIETSFDLIRALNNEISNCDYFFMNAAVSDFKMASDTSSKIPKNKINDHLNKNFELVPDILKEISEFKKDNQVFVGFCAYTGSIEEARIIVKEKISKKGCDYLFANPIDLEGQGFGSLAKNEGWLFDTKNMEYYISKTSKIDLANKLITKIIAVKK
ncbi:bifunctional phosphopantothenoylcysteine decarboxylase/phosphopantothenate--cysteine ligase CoaBC [Prochlorococcus marinus str. MU1404]|uniref:bifunctional phosphopantothenoylcysteine decarboxylase/phosphopantothenate--cysteine ligase CoaBC n=1 Tax=Prochlorococcus marinus TaxID=1219 RepID=UPI001ADBBB0B|nr:bifunctional phosphopantothenoylcysteine decarboxylase/phosphopantothenate--cysteine ligase CoaBC [Prochlorococcus marinus]MBO8229400.1 bifunctional phosphopantothenoylcysteine decarboxylase/phosphopantothenate--cysteine ligase CoaBC [Prochlorococcus marinus XMU1404]MBW3072483.1 bifunctional phosphopantothenoylcysteine decarboxylase/phosphopantothenate--cysteine ligase CoaBC [Prochlorococcus marinus str. MU1404]MCR8544416.1 bifunctional phosphopantothenoylcysteine decarboxylase/phosphopantoth